MGLLDKKASYTYQMLNIDHSKILQSVSDSSTQEIIKYGGIIIAMIFSAIFNVFLIFILLLIDNILAYMCYKKYNKTNLWTSNGLFRGLIKKLFIYLLIVITLIVATKIFNEDDIFLIGLTIITFPEVKSIDEKIQCLFNTSIISAISSKINHVFTSNSQIRNVNNTTSNTTPNYQQNTETPPQDKPITIISKSN